jgi:hypothetical protein
MPGSRDSGLTWTDTNGNLWMFGGFSGYSGAKNRAVGNFLNDLWTYSPTKGQWTWIGGSNAVCSQGVYGTQGVAAPTNLPAARATTIRWTDTSGNVWLFGGGSCDATGAFILRGDLWKFSPSSREWTWVAGTSASNESPDYGTEGVAGTANTPGARDSAAAWTDANGNMLMFGGYGTAPPGSHIARPLHNDLWEYLPSSNQWAWIGGPSTLNAKGVYGIQGAADAANIPGARSGAVYWTDAQGNFWLFGGYGCDATGTRAGLLNDLWRYSTSSGEWTWVGGSNTLNATGGNVPAARASSTTWTDPSGDVWLFGGEGFDIPTNSYHRLNDLWKYSPSTGQWTWAAGSTANNVPGARAAPSRWKDATGTVWLFGGFQYEEATNTRFEMNDLWKLPTQ